MEEEIEQTEACENCEQQIPSSKLPLHEAYCIRFCRKCDVCGDFIHKDEMEDHKQGHLLGTLQRQVSEKVEKQETEKKMEIEGDLPDLVKQQSSIQPLHLNPKQSSVQKQVIDGKVYCSNCSKAIPENLIDMHEAQCIKNNVKCQQCNEFIHKDLIEEHNREVHLKCQYCQKKLHVDLLQGHEKVCLKGGQQCKLCKNQFNSDVIEDHLEFCAGSTDDCLYCFKFIKKSQKYLHDKICYANPENNQGKFDPLKKHVNLEVETSKNFIEYLKNEITKFTIQSEITPGQALHLLDQYGWNFDTAPMYAMQHIQKPEQEIQNLNKKATNLQCCLICLKEFTEGPESYYSLPCNHRACNDCYSRYIKINFKTGLRSLETPCFFKDCQDMVCYEGFQRYLSENEYKLYWSYIEMSALYSSPVYNICPNQQCNSILHNSQNPQFSMKSNVFNAFCPKCRQHFCNKCKEEAHLPLTCEAYKKFSDQKGQFTHNMCYTVFQREKGNVQKFVLEQKSQLEIFQQMIETNQDLSFQQQEIFYQVYKEGFDTLIQGQIIYQWGQIIGMYDNYPAPIVEIWITQQLKKKIDSMEKVLTELETCDLVYINKIRNENDSFQKLIDTILMEFVGKKQEIKNTNLGQQDIYQHHEDDFQEEEYKQSEQQQQQHQEFLQQQEQKMKEQQEIDKKEQEQLQKTILESQKKCTECKENPATMEGEICDNCFDLLYGYDDQDDYGNDDVVDYDVDED